VSLHGTVSSADLGGSSKYSGGPLRTEVEKGSAITEIGCGLVDPKGWGSSVLKWIRPNPKGNPVKIPELGTGIGKAERGGDTKERSDANSGAGENCLFLITGERLWNQLGWRNSGMPGRAPSGVRSPAGGP